MKHIHTLLILFFLFSSLSNIAQDKVLIEIEDQHITQSEFVQLYKKNNSATSLNKSTIDEYLELYINFKLKVLEAKALGLDTLSSFTNELSGYRQQLAQPYLSSERILEKLKKEAYERMKEEVRVSHILINVGQDASSKDTLEAYKKAKKVLKLLKEGSDFVRTAQQYSDDESVKINNGDLGYFTAFQMVYPFESASYDTPKGEFSDIVRSRFGYHIIKVEDKRPANGIIHARHILISTDGKYGNPVDAEGKINEIYKQLEKGEDFEMLAKQFSDDVFSSRQGGELQPFTINQMVEDFQEKVLALNEGDYSKPFKTQYGWHIAQLIKKEGIKPYEEIEHSIEQKVKRDSRGNQTKGALLSQIKDQYGFKENHNALKDFYTIVDDTYFDVQWEPSAAKHLNKFMFSIGDQTITQVDFTNYLSKHQVRRGKTNVEVLVNRLYDKFQKEELLAYKNSKLEEEEPEFKALVGEYHDGILLFNLTDEMVWSKAIEDTNALKDFYQKNKERYKWDKRVEATLYNSNNEEIAQKAIKLIEAGKSNEDIASELNTSSNLNIKYEEGKIYLKGDHPIVDEVKWTKGISKTVKKDNRVFFVDIKEVLQPSYKTLDEARGLIISDYQDQIEKEWVKELREKYNFKVNKTTLKKLKNDMTL